MHTLVVTAVDAERDAIRAAAQGLTVETVGVGPAAAAAGTSALLARSAYDLVICAGIGGGFAPLVPGDLAVAAHIVFADLGAQTADGFRSATELGFGVDAYEVHPRLAVELADATGAHLGTVLTVSTVTGTAESADALLERHQAAVAEGMEGAGVAAAAQVHGIAFGEIRAISNPIGPRDRGAWRIPEALTALGGALAAVAARGQ